MSSGVMVESVARSRSPTVRISVPIGISTFHFTLNGERAGPEKRHTTGYARSATGPRPAFKPSLNPARARDQPSAFNTLQLLGNRILGGVSWKGTNGGLPASSRQRLATFSARP